MFAERIVGLQLGSIVYDGAPDGLTADVLTRIYGEEDWEATISATDDEDEGSEVADESEPAPSTEDHNPPTPDRDRLAGMT
jgi:phosphonate transport system ATP-binding protein